jgi:hypothetical protein
MTRPPTAYVTTIEGIVNTLAIALEGFRKIRPMEVAGVIFSSVPYTDEWIYRVLIGETGIYFHG